MCVIFACETSKPSEDDIVSAGWTNPDGAGIAWVETPTKGAPVVRWEKGMKDGEEVIEALKPIKTFPILMHFRIATCGGKIPQLTHPFPITPQVDIALRGAAPAVMMHNGHWNDWDKRVWAMALAKSAEWPKGAWSDSRALAWVLSMGGAGALDFLYHQGVSPDRVVTLSAQGGGSLDYWGNWIDKKGFFASNDSYERWGKKTSGYDTQANRSTHHQQSWVDDEEISEVLAREAEAKKLKPHVLMLPPAGISDISPGVSGPVRPIQDEPLMVVLRDLLRSKELMGGR